MNYQALASSLDLLVDLIAKRVAHHLRGDEVPPPENAERSPWMSVDSAAVYVDWPKQRLYKLTAAGRIPHCKVDGRLVFHRDELDHWLWGHAQGASE